MYAMNLNAYRINLDAPITAPLRSPQYVADEVIDRIDPLLGIATDLAGSVSRSIQDSPQ